jgi:sorbitol/mannitol transport system substrate-binding protein
MSKLARTRASGITRVRFTLAAAAVSALFATGLVKPSR